VALFLTAAVAITAVALAVRYRSETRETSDYLVVVDEIVQEELLVSQSLHDVFESLGPMERPEIVERITVLGERTEAAEVQLSEAVVTRPAAELHGLMTVAVRGWSAGIDALDEAMIEVMEQPNDAEIQPDSFMWAVDQLRVGDAAYAAFLEAAPGLETDVPPPDYPAVSFLGGEQPVDIDAIADRLRLRTILGGRQNIAITANTEPEPTGDRNGVAVMPFDGSFDVTAIVTNSGNVVSEEIAVTLTLSIDGSEGGEVFSERRFIASLQPEDSMSLEFLDVELEPETLYTLRVVAEIAEDADIEDNVWEVMFATNAR
jgi:hypothetical protein